MVLRHVTIAVTADPASLAPARHLLVAVATAFECPVDTWALQLLVSEVLANAVDHGHGELCIEVTRLVGGALRVEVVNPGTGWPERRRPEPLDEQGGRGLLIVDALAASWGARTGEDEVTAVWFELAPRSTVPDRGPAVRAARSVGGAVGRGAPAARS